VKELCREPDYVCEHLLSDTIVDAALFCPARSARLVSAGTSDTPAIAIYGEVFQDSRPAGPALADALRGSRHDKAGDVLNRFDGSFCGFVWWAQSKTGVIFVDHSASRPVYYADDDGDLWFAPEPKALRAAGNIATTLDRAALASYLTAGHVLNDQTFYKEVRSLSPGTMLEITATGWRTVRYFRYSLSDEGKEPADDSRYAERLNDALRLAIERRVSRISECVIPISGGWDSRGILAYVRQIFDGPVQTVSWGTTEDNTTADAATGRRLAEHFGTRHVFLQRNPERMPDNIEEMVSRTDGMTTDAAFHSQEVEFMRRLRDELGVSYLLRGDEVFGYMAAAHSEPEALGRIGIRPMTDFPDLLSAVRTDVRRELSSELDATLAEMSASCSLTNYTARKDFFYFHERLRNYLHRANYYKLGVLDSSNPWLDKHILAVNEDVPVPYRVDKELYKRTIMRYFPGIGVPIASRHSLEDWDSVISGSARVRQFVFDHLGQRNSQLYTFLSPEVLAARMSAVAAGRQEQQQSLKVRAITAAKRMLAATSPALYKMAQRQAGGKVRTAAFPAVELLFRALVLKLWFDRYAPARL
jgi:asparagine synthetase B (glutamine-hydrolysing)